MKPNPSLITAKQVKQYNISKGVAPEVPEVKNNIFESGPDYRKNEIDNSNWSLRLSRPHAFPKGLAEPQESSEVRRRNDIINLDTEIPPPNIVLETPVKEEIKNKNEKFETNEKVVEHDYVNVQEIIRETERRENKENKQKLITKFQPGKNIDEKIKELDKNKKFQEPEDYDKTEYGNQGFDRNVKNIFKRKKSKEGKDIEKSGENKAAKWREKGRSNSEENEEKQNKNASKIIRRSTELSHITKSSDKAKLLSYKTNININDNKKLAKNEISSESSSSNFDVKRIERKNEDADTIVPSISSKTKEIVNERRVTTDQITKLSSQNNINNDNINDNNNIELKPVPMPRQLLPTTKNTPNRQAESLIMEAVKYRGGITRAKSPSPLQRISERSETEFSSNVKPKLVQKPEPPPRPSLQAVNKNTNNNLNVKKIDEKTTFTESEQKLYELDPSKLVELKKEEILPAMEQKKEKNDFIRL